ncbi:MAG: AAA family ATPase [Eubacterium sp.]
MKEINIPVGISDFKEICKNGYYYVDKTFFDQRITEDNSDQSYIDHQTASLWKNHGNEYVGDLF